MEGSMRVKGDNQYFFKMFGFMKPFAAAYAIGMLFYSSQGFATVYIMSLFSGNIMEAVLAEDTRAVVMSAVIMMAMIVGFLVFLSLGVYIYVMSEAKAIRGLKRQLFRTFVRSSLESPSNGHSGEGIAAINTDANTASEVFGWPLTSFLMCIINIVFSSVVVFTIDWRLGISAVAIGLLGFLVQHRFTGPIARIGKEQLEVNASTVKTVSNIFSGAISIRAYNMQQYAVVTFDRDNGRLKFLGFKRALISMWQDLFSTVQGWLTLVAVFGLGGWLVATDRLEFHLLVMAPFMCMTIASSFGRIGEAYANLQRPIEGAKRVFQILENGDAEREVKGGGSDLAADGYALRIENLSFSYLGAEGEALRGIDLEVGENEMVALVGESGSGKSTLLRAIIGMYEREDLGMSLGDLCFNDSSLRGWRRNFAYVDQSCKLFDMSVRENIAMGKGGAADDDEIEAAARRAAAHEFIEGLEGGYDAPCGEKGGVLSGGQKQRIAIARALVKGAPILVVDEATSALDNESERQVMATIESLRSDHTVLITTHNLENIVGADRIVVLDGGRIVESGSHQELLSLGGLYHRLYNQSGSES